MEKQDKLHYICSIEYKTDSMTQDRCLCWAFYLFFLNPALLQEYTGVCVWCKSCTLCYSVLCRIIFHQNLVRSEMFRLHRIFHFEKSPGFSMTLVSDYVRSLFADLHSSHLKYTRCCFELLKMLQCFWQTLSWVNLISSCMWPILTLSFNFIFLFFFGGGLLCNWHHN